MPIVNFNKREMWIKIVYYGPALCGKTTSLEFVYKQTPEKHRGAMTSAATETDRTLFFDYMPMDLGNVNGYQMRLQLYTVPGQVYYNDTRKVVLKNTDGIIFVADSQSKCMPFNIESLANLRENLAEDKLDMDAIPLVFHYNKRDLPNLSSVAEMEAALNPRGLPYFEGVACEGIGVFDALRKATRTIVTDIREKNMFR